MAGIPQTYKAVVWCISKIRYNYNPDTHKIHKAVVWCISKIRYNVEKNDTRKMYAVVWCISKIRYNAVRRNCRMSRLWFDVLVGKINILYKKLLKTNKLPANKTMKFQNEYVFTRNLSLMQYKIEKARSTNWKSINGRVNSSWKIPIKIKLDFTIYTFKHSIQKYPTIPKLTKKNVLSVNVLSIILIICKCLFLS